MFTATPDSKAPYPDEKSAMFYAQQLRAIAQATEAELGKVSFVAEPCYDVFFPGCKSGRSLPFRGTTTSYEANALAQVEVTKDILVSFHVK